MGFAYAELGLYIGAYTKLYLANNNPLSLYEASEFRVGELVNSARSTTPLETPDAGFPSSLAGRLVSFSLTGEGVVTGDVEVEFKVFTRDHRRRALPADCDVTCNASVRGLRFADYSLVAELNRIPLADLVSPFGVNEPRKGRDMAEALLSTCSNSFFDVILEAIVGEPSRLPAVNEARPNLSERIAPPAWQRGAMDAGIDAGRR
jgi:hypothetical protein